MYLFVMFTPAVYTSATVVFSAIDRSIILHKKQYDGQSYNI